MGFKSMTEYNDQRYGNWFRLQNDGDYADVIFLYRGMRDAMMADTHYIKTDGYTGYVTCCGRGCAACAQKIRIQPKLFIPLYVIGTSVEGGIQGRVQFWDRTMRFQPQLVNDVFRGYPNPSEFVFRITRHGVAGDINTTYDIRAISNNNNPETSYDAICSAFGVTFPDYYNTICKDVDAFELSSMMTSSSYGQNSNGGGYGGGYGGYNATPRGGAPTPPPAPPMPPVGNSIPGTSIPYTGTTMPNVPLNSPVPESAPDPNDLPFGGAPTPPPAPTEDDPLRTDEDIDTTNLQF